jgi:hypothetical protein
MDTEIIVLSLYSRVQHERKWYWFAFLDANVTVPCSRLFLFVVKISFQVNTVLLLFPLQPVAKQSILRKPDKLTVVLKCTLTVFPCLFKMTKRDLMKRGKQNVLFVEQTVHKTNGKRNIYAHMYDTARHCELIITYKLHLGSRSELCSGISPLFMRNDVCCFRRKRIWKI